MTSDVQLKTLYGVKKLGLLVGFFLLWGFYAQAQKVNSSVDSTTIKIGEKITYKITVEADSSARVFFPKGQTFKPLEVFDSTAVDTFQKKDIRKLQKEYSLTQFDSGAYTIPRQKILIGDEPFYTDSVQVRVNAVAIDTTKQKMYPIKPSVAVKKAFSIPNWIWWVLGGIVVLGVVIFLLLRLRKKIIEKREELPPYEKAIQSLKTLDESQQLEHGKVKEYYSSLSLAVKRYIDEKIDDRALESTTNELIVRLKELEKEKKIYLKKQVIDSLNAILNRADLAKFAGINTDKLTARDDRQTIEDNINAFDKAIPEPTEEELLQDQVYREEQERKRRKRKMIIGIGIGIVAVLIAGAVFIGIKGFDYTKELVFSNPTKELLHGDWITSEYGNNGVTVTTPRVLVRQMDTVKSSFPGKTKLEERFSYGSYNGNLFVQVTNIRFKKSAKIDSINVGDILEKRLKSKGIKNVTLKHKDFTTSQDVKGQRVFGTFTIKNPVTKSEIKKEYAFLLFNEKGGLQEILVSFDHRDENADDIKERIVNSISFNSDKSEDNG